MADNKREYYSNTACRGGKPTSQGAHVASMKKIDSATSHLVQPVSGKVKAAGDQGPKEHSKPIKSTMPLAKKVAGGSNY